MKPPEVSDAARRKRLRFTVIAGAVLFPPVIAAFLGAWGFLVTIFSDLFGSPRGLYLLHFFRLLLYGLILLGVHDIIQSYLSLGPVTTLIFRRYHPKGVPGSDLRWFRIGLYQGLAKFGRVDGIMPGGSRASKFFRAYGTAQAESIETGGEDWKDVAVGALKQARLVVVELSEVNENIEWEIEASLKYLPRKQIVIADFRQDTEEEEIQRAFTVVKPGSRVYSGFPWFSRSAKEIEEHAARLLGAPGRRRCWAHALSMWCFRLSGFVICGAAVPLILFIAA